MQKYGYGHDGTLFLGYHSQRTNEKHSAASRFGCSPIFSCLGQTPVPDPATCTQVAIPVSLFLLGLNVASVVAGASLAKSKGRSVPLWVFKGALAGIASVLELKGLPDLVANSGSSSTVSQE